MENREVARILRETANLLELDGGDIGRYRSYEKVAQTLDNLSERIEDLTRAGTLTELPGVGDRMAAHIQEILRTGKYSLHQKLLKKYPHTLLDILNLPSLGPKKNRAAVEEVQGRDRGRRRKTGTGGQAARPRRFR